MGSESLAPLVSWQPFRVGATGGAKQHHERSSADGLADLGFYRCMLLIFIACVTEPVPMVSLSHMLALLVLMAC